MAEAIALQNLLLNMQFIQIKSVTGKSSFLKTWTPYLLIRVKNLNRKEHEITRDDLLKEIGQLKVENVFLKKKYKQLFG
jgi:hypothetical protein